MNSDTSLLIELLRPKKEKLSTKAISSIPSPVINLNKVNSQIEMDVLKERLIDAFKKRFGECDVYSDFDHSLIGNYKNASKWDHVFANTPKFSLDYQSNELNLNIKVEGIDCRGFMALDGLHPDYFNDFCKSVIGKRYEPSSLIYELSKEISENQVITELGKALID